MVILVYTAKVSRSVSDPKYCVQLIRIKEVYIVHVLYGYVAGYLYSYLIFYTFTPLNNYYGKLIFFDSFIEKIFLVTMCNDKIKHIHSTL